MIGPGAGARRTPVFSIPVCATIFACLLLSRDPAILADAQFWAEDGTVWFAQAHSLGLAALLRPESTYLQTVARLVAWAAVKLPLRWSPTAYAAAAFAIQLLVPLFFVSDRCAALWPKRAERFAFGCLLMVLPNTTEVYVNLTNSQWHLALLAFLILQAAPAASIGGFWFDSLALALSAFSGPFSILLLPSAAIALWGTPTRAQLVRTVLLGAGALVQLAVIAAAGHGRSSAPLGASLAGLVQIIADQVVYAGLFGISTLGAVAHRQVWSSGLVPAAFCLLALVMAAIACRRAGRPMVQACLFAGLVMAAALRHPQISATDPQWPALMRPNSGGRYFFIPLAVWLAVCASLLRHPSGPVRVLAGACVGCTLLVAVPNDWARWSEPDRGFPALARRFDASPRGTVMTLPIRPWISVTLRR